MKLGGRILSLVMVALLSGPTPGLETPVSPLPTIDFKQVYPWLVWTSSEGHDAHYPHGFQYKLLSVRTADSTTVEFVLLRQLSDGSQTLVLHAKGPLGKFEEAVTTMLDNLSRKLGVTFQRTDLRDVQDFADFKARASELGWPSEATSAP